MGSYPEVVERAIEELSNLPGIGRKSAERIVFYLLDRPRESAKKLASAIYYMREKVRFCEVCNNFSQDNLCPICSSDARDRTMLCVVEQPSDVAVIEKAGIYKGLYYVLLGSVSPLDGPGKNSGLNLGKLASMLKRFPIREVIIATDADTDGEMTALYVQEFLNDHELDIFRIGMGLPVGANIEYMDATTIAKALQCRVKMRL